MAIAALNPAKLSDRQGPTSMFYKGKLFYVWRSDNSIYFQQKGFWNKKFAFAISDVNS